MEERLKLWTKTFLSVVQQKFDLSNANIPPFMTFLRWFSIGGSAVILSAAANGFILKFLLFPEIKIARAKKQEASEDGPALIVNLERPKADDFKDVLKRNIFNSEQKEEVVKDSSAAKTQCVPVKSELALKFTGVIFGGTKEASLVLMEATATKDADTFILNDVVPGEAKIVDIQRDKVFLLRSAADCPEYLELQQPEPVKRRVPGTARSRAGAGLAAVKLGDVEFSEQGFARNRDGNIVADRRWVDKALTTDFAKTLQDAKASPNIVDGGPPKGFVLTRIRPDSVYEKMGFQDGDVVETINGIDLNDAARAIQTLNSLKQENMIELLVKRNGVTRPMKIQVK